MYSSPLTLNLLLSDDPELFDLFEILNSSHDIHEAGSLRYLISRAAESYEAWCVMDNHLNKSILAVAIVSISQNAVTLLAAGNGADNAAIELVGSGPVPRVPIVTRSLGYRHHL